MSLKVGDAKRCPTRPSMYQGSMDVLRVESMTVKQEYDAVRQRYDNVMSRCGL